MVTTNPFTLLKEQVDPMIETIREDMSPLANNPIIALLRRDTIKMQVPESGILELYHFRSAPCVVIGDRWAYQASGKNMDVGKIKFKKYTIQVKLTEDEVDRIEQIGVDALVARGLRNQLKTNQAYLEDQLLKWIIDPWNSVTTSEEYDSLYLGLFAPSNAGTISNPSDLNATAGTALDKTALKFSGAGQTANNIQQLLSSVLPSMVKKDYNTHLQVPVNNLYLGVEPVVYSILKSTRDIMNSTTGQRDTQTYLQSLIASGINVIESVWFDQSYSYSTGNTSRLCFFSNPQENCYLYVIEPPNGQTWSEWDKIHENMGEKNVILYEKHKKVEMGVNAQAYYVNTSATAGSYFKAMFFATITPYATS